MKLQNPNEGLSSCRY